MTRATAVLAISLLCCGARVLPAQSRELLGQGVKAYQALEYDAAAALLEQRLGRDAASAPADNGSYLVRVTPRTLTADGPRARQVLLEVKQERPDTLAWPPPLTTPPLLPERTSSGPAFRSLAAGLVAGAAAVALPSIMAQGKDATGARFAVGAAGAARLRGPVLGGEGRVVFNGFSVGVGLLSGTLQNGDQTVKRDFIEGRLLVAARPVPWLEMSVGPFVRAYVTDSSTGRWVFWQARARVDAPIVTASLTSYVELL